MSTAHLYENFADPLLTNDDQFKLSEEDIADEKLESFETGYSSGWDDAVQAHEESKSAVSSTLKECLERATLTKDDAFEQFIVSAEDLIGGIVKQVLPAVSRDVLGEQIREILVERTQDAVTAPLRIAVSPADYENLTALSEEWLPTSTQIAADPTLEAGQADVSVGETETHVDLAGVVEQVTDAVEAFFHVVKEGSSDDG